TAANPAAIILIGLIRAFPQSVIARHPSFRTGGRPGGGVTSYAALAWLYYTMGAAEVEGNVTAAQLENAAS
ncbi:MAG: hypothetical protein LBS11_06675, partial [Oscillospiraceae bacterium]|nr:hypothetical protein [Oscillospiraceae bacterium]